MGPQCHLSVFTFKTTGYKRINKFRKTSNNTKKQKSNMTLFEGMGQIYIQMFIK